jgi:hypothetical protein
MIPAYLALFAGFNIIISLLLWFFMSGRMTIKNLVLSLSIYAGIIIVAVMTAQFIGHDLIGMITHRTDIFFLSVIAGMKKYNMPETDLQNLFYMQEMAVSFIRSCPVAFVYITVLLTGFLNLFLARLFLIPAEHRLPRLRHPPEKKEPIYDENDEIIETPKPLFEDEIPPGPLSPEGLQLGFGLVWFFIASWAGLLIAYKIGVPLMKTISLNLFLICGTLYVIQGLMVVSSFYRRFSINRIIKIVILFFMLTILPTLILILCVISLGLFDAWFDLRKLKSDGGH